MKTLLERFVEKYMPEPNSGCWLWLGSCSRGYGSFSINGRLHKAHRISYEMHRGPIPEGLQLDHLCRVRCCVNPDHLEPVTARVNQRRSNSIPASNARKTYCTHGHELAGDNLYVKPNGQRQCRICARKRTQRYYARKHKRAA